MISSSINNDAFTNGEMMLRIYFTINKTIERILILKPR